LFVQPYDGDFGTFEVGAGGRDMYPEMAVQGSLRSEIPPNPAESTAE
jgi:hypothetical protein